MRRGLSLPVAVASRLVPALPGRRFLTPPWLLPADFFAHSVYGSDDNDGRSPLTPFKTLARLKTALLAWGAGVRAGLMAGSYWPEEFDIYDIPAAAVRGYGADIATAGMPVITGADLIEGGWQSNIDRGDEYDKVWTRSLAFTIDAHQQAIPPHFWEDGLIPAWSASLAAAQAAPDSWGHDGDTSATSPVLLWVHPAGSTNPNTDGRERKASTRNWALRVADDAIVELVRPECQGHDNGSVNAGRRARIRHCVFAEHPIHLALAASGEMENCVFWASRADARTGSILAEFFTPDGQGLTGVFRGCVARGVPTGTIKGFGGHVSGPSDATNYASMSLIDCLADNCDAYFATTMNAIVERVKVVDGQLRWLSESANGVASWTDPCLIGTGARNAGVASGSIAASRLTVRGLRAFGSAAFTDGILSGLYNADIQRSIVVTKTDANTEFLRSTHASAVYLGAKFCIFVYDGIGAAKFIRLTGGAGHLPDTDNNVYSGFGNWTVNNGGPVTYTDLATLQAETGMDLNSIAVDRRALLDPNAIGPTAFFIGTGWTTPSPGVWVQDGTGSTATARLQFNVAAGVYEIVFTVTGPGTVSLRNGGTVIAAGRGEGTYVYRSAIAANINWVPSGECTLTDISARGIPADLKNPIYVQDPANGDWTVVGDLAGTGAGLDRPNVSYLTGPATLAEAEAWILARARV